MRKAESQLPYDKLRLTTAMPQAMTRRLLTISLFAALLAGTVEAQDFTQFTGKWNMTSETNSDPVRWTMTVSGTSAKPEAMLSTEEGGQAAADVSYESGTLSFKVSYQGGDYTIELRYVNGKLDGTWRGAGESGKTTGVKAQ